MGDPLDFLSREGQGLEFTVEATDDPSWLFGAESWYELFERLSDAEFGER